MRYVIAGVLVFALMLGVGLLIGHYLAAHSLDFMGRYFMERR